MTELKDIINSHRFGEKTIYYLNTRNKYVAKEINNDIKKLNLRMHHFNTIFEDHYIGFCIDHGLFVFAVSKRDIANMVHLKPLNLKDMLILIKLIRKKIKK